MPRWKVRQTADGKDGGGGIRPNIHHAGELGHLSFTIVTGMCNSIPAQCTSVVRESPTIRTQSGWCLVPEQLERPTGGFLLYLVVGVLGTGYPIMPMVAVRTGAQCDLPSVPWDLHCSAGTASAGATHRLHQTPMFPVHHCLRWPPSHVRVAGAPSRQGLSDDRETRHVGPSRSIAIHAWRAVSTQRPTTGCIMDRLAHGIDSG